jgi:hypothetical protein
MTAIQRAYNTWTELKEKEKKAKSKEPDGPQQRGKAG